MKDNHMTEILPDYVDGLLGSAQRNVVEKHLKECASCKKDLEELQVLLTTFKEEKEIIPTDRIRSEFLAFLEQEKKRGTDIISLARRHHGASGFLKIAAGLALLIGSFFLGRFQQKQESNQAIAVLENRNLAIKEMAILSLIESQSASRRIQGVNYIEEFTHPDEEIVKALTSRMLYDENTIVRLRAVEALGRFTSSEIVKNAFITALRTEKDPSIQISIIHALAGIQEKKAILPMQQLLDQEETQPFVKQQIRSLLPDII
jgi:hypothetical protein